MYFHFIKIEEFVLLSAFTSWNSFLKNYPSWTIWLSWGTVFRGKARKILDCTVLVQWILKITLWTHKFWLMDVFHFTAVTILRCSNCSMWSVGVFPSWLPYHDPSRRYSLFSFTVPISVCSKIVSQGIVTSFSKRTLFRDHNLGSSLSLQSYIVSLRGIF